MRCNISTGTLIAFTFLAIIAVSQAIVLWLPFWKETTVFRYHPKKGWHAIKHSGSNLWKPKRPLRLPSLLYRHHRNRHQHHHPPHFNPFRHFHPHRHFHLRGRGPHVHSPVHVLKKFKQWKPIHHHQHHHRPHKHLCPTCHLTSWKPRKQYYHDNGIPFSQPPFSTIHHDFPKFFAPHPAHIFPKMGPIVSKAFSHPKYRTVLRIKKYPKNKHNNYNYFHKPGQLSKGKGFSHHDPYGKIHSFQKQSPYPVVSHFSKPSFFPKEHLPKFIPFPTKSHHPQSRPTNLHVDFPKINPYSTINHSPRLNPYIGNNQYPLRARPSPNSNPFSTIENSAPLFSSQFSFGDNNNFNTRNRFPKVNHLHHPEESPSVPKNFGNFGNFGPGGMELSGFASGKKGHGWGGWDW